MEQKPQQCVGIRHTCMSTMQKVFLGFVPGTEKEKKKEEKKKPQ